MTATENREVVDKAAAFMATERYRECRADLDLIGPLPSVEAVAAPLIAALEGLWSAYEGRADAMEFGIEQGVFLAEADELIDHVQQVASLVATTVGCLLADDRVAFSQSMRGIVHAISDVHKVEIERQRAQRERWMFAD